ncbi:MAG: dihydroorotate dehydrogenase [Candidatus Diapherotrites archaeon]|nr:dihydroorotate dehydrogenase [Candidatus Micrarchaeota archaeon]MBU1939428.1 dihydroorotate dehydrogenase [Candidatus Micrarchaeota archaeon]
MNIRAELSGVKMRNPTVLPSGILGTGGGLLKRAAEAGAGAVTTKSIGPRERTGHANPTVIKWEHGVINAVGLPTPGYANMADEWAEIKKIRAPVIASIYGGSVEEFVEVAKAVAKEKPAIIELNISCPNSEKHGQLFGFEPEPAAEVTRAVKKVCGSVPVMPKLTPNTHKIAEVAKACEKAGADAICAINTVQGMLINAEAKKPVLANKFGGISGGAIKPVALKCVYEIYENVKVPILGMGGISNGRDAIEMIEAGATAIGIGSAAYKGMGIFSEVCTEMEEWMQKNGYSSLKQLRGAAHE